MRRLLRARPYVLVVALAVLVLLAPSLGIADTWSYALAPLPDGSVRIVAPPGGLLRAIGLPPDNILVTAPELPNPAIPAGSEWARGAGEARPGEVFAIAYGGVLGFVEGDRSTRQDPLALVAILLGIMACLIPWRGVALVVGAACVDVAACAAYGYVEPPVGWIGVMLPGALALSGLALAGALPRPARWLAVGAAGGALLVGLAGVLDLVPWTTVMAASMVLGGLSIAAQGAGVLFRVAPAGSSPLEAAAIGVGLLLPPVAAARAHDRQATRERVAADLHAEVLPLLADALHQLDVGRATTASERVSEAELLLRAIVAERRLLVLETGGLLPALEWLVERRLTDHPATAIDLVVDDASTDDRPPLEVEQAAFRVAELALENAACHAKGAPVTIVVRAGHRSTRLTVRNATAPPTSGIRSAGPRFGLADMTMEAARVRARVSIDDHDGFAVRFAWPADEAAEGAA